VEGDGLDVALTLHALQLDADGLLGIRGVDHLDDDLARRAVEDAGGEEPVLSGLSGYGLLLHGERQHVGALVHGEELLNVVTDGLEGAEIVEPDGIRTPLPALDVGEEGSVGGHVDDVGITLDTRHVGGLVERGLEVVPLLAVAVAGIFAGKHTGALAVVCVVAQAVGEEPLLIAVVVLVVEVYLQLLHAGLQQVEVPSLGVGACGADEFQRGVLGAEGGDELLQALSEHRTEAAVGLVVVPLLVAHAEVLQVEGFGVAHVCAHLTPLRVNGAVGKLHEVEGILDVVIEVVEGHMHALLRGVGVLELAGESAGDDGQGLAAEVFAELEELEEAETVTLEVVGIEAVAEGVVPAVLVQRTVLNGAYAVLPLVAGLEVCTLYDAASGESEHARVHVGECLSQVAAHAVLTTLPGVGGEEGDMLHVSRGLVACEEDAEGTLRLRLRRRERGGVLLPLLAADLYVDSGKALVFTHRGIVNETHLEGALAAFGATGPEGEAVGLVLHDGNTEEAFVLKARELVAVAGVFQTHIVGIALEGSVVFHLEVTEGAPAHEALGELERAVLHHLGIEAAVGSVVDILEEDTVHRGLYGCPKFLGVHVHDVCLCRRREAGSKQKQSR